MTVIIGKNPPIIKEKISNVFIGIIVSSDGIAITFYLNFKEEHEK